MVAAWPDATMTTNGAASDEVAARRIEDTQKLVTDLRRFRNDQGVKPSQRVPARMSLIEADLDGQEDIIRSLARAEEPRCAVPGHCLH